HDPARAPFRVVDEKDFNEAWSQSGYWTMVATRSASPAPEPDSPVVRTDGDGSPKPSSPCGAMVDEGVRLAGAADIEAARRLLEVAAQSCPGSPDPWRELAGLHALRNEWHEAAADARRALSHAPDDALAARILATSLYLDGDPDGALDAWNLVGEPVIDLVKVTGLERTRYRAAARTLGLEPHMLLTRRAIEAARRRLAELPSSQGSRVAYRPGENGRTDIEAVVLERARLPVSPVMLAGTAVHALTDRELVVGVASPSGGGEMWTLGWRWWDRRPRVALGFAAPSPFGGLWGVDLFDERQTYGGRGGPIEEARQRASFHISDWTHAGFRWEGVAGVDRFDEAGGSRTGRAFALAFSGQQRLAADRAYLEARAGAWMGTVRTWTVGLRGEWRSSTRNEGRVWIGRAGAEIAPSAAPLALWPGAGTGTGRDVLLRAHPLLDHGVIAKGLFAPRLTHGGVEWRRWLSQARPVRIAPALFLDVAGTSAGLVRSDRRWQSDLGAGLRIGMPGSGVVRIDLARGLRDGATALSIGWTR
ncbi:MAG: tetratricopeptide repeat protein, partial [Acidobacteriota bacterium]